MKTVRMSDGLDVYCLSRPETVALDEHVNGYFRHGVDVKPGDVILDVGANVGLFAVRAMHRANGQAKIFSFEPTPPVFEVLARNANKFGERIEPINVAVGAARGTLNLTYYPRCPSLSSAHSHLWDASPGGLAVAVERAMESPPAGYEWATRLLPSWSKSWVAKFMIAKQTHFECPMTSLAVFISERQLSKVDLLKVDVEGAEYDVLKGVGSADWAKIRGVVVEVHDVGGRLQGLQELLGSHGFSRQTVEVEPGFVGTNLKNLYAVRSLA